MFQHLKEANIPPGALAEPVTMHQVGRGKLHATSTCRRDTRPVKVVLWNADFNRLCEQCTTDQNLPLWDARNRRRRLWTELGQLAKEPRPTDLTAKAVGLSHAFWSRLEQTLNLLVATRTHPVLARSYDAHDDDLEHWRQRVYVPQATAELGGLLEEFKAFTRSDWDLRYASISKLSFETSPALQVVGPTPSGHLRPGTPDHRLVTELRNGLLYRWFTSADLPRQDDLVQAALEAVGDWTDASFAPTSAAEEMVEILLDSHSAAVGKADSVYEWGPASPAGMSAAEPPRALLALLSQARVVHPFEHGSILVLPRAVVDVIPLLGNYDRTGSPRPWFGAIYGPAAPEDTAQVLHTAATLRREGFHHREALEAARLSHVQPPR